MSKNCRSHCSTANALEVVGDRWSLLLIRDYIFVGHREYGHFMELMEGISTNILASRLEWLVDSNIFIKHPHPTNKKKYYYEITDKGFDLIIIIMELASWGWRHLPAEKAFSPNVVKSAYKKNPSAFKKEWKTRVEQRTKDYLKDALS